MRLRELSLRGELTFFAAVSCITILALYIHWLPPFMILWGLFWILQNGIGSRDDTNLNNKHFVLFLLFMVLLLWQTGELILADSFKDGFERIFKRLSMFLFPLVLFSPGFKIKNNITLILKIFAISIFFYLLYCFGNALHNSLIFKDGKLVFNAYHELYTYESFFMGARLSDAVHPTYLAMYVLLSVIISFESYLDTSLSLIRRYLWLCGFLFFTIVIYLLSSRAGVLAAFIILPFYFTARFYKRFSKFIIILIVAVVLSGGVVLIKTNDRLKYSLEDISSTGLSGTLNKDSRYTIWKSAIGVIKQNMLVGVGTGNASRDLKKEFIRRGYTEGYYEDLNAHNQFLEILLENGITGFVIFISLLGFLIYAAIAEKNLFLFLFVIMMFIFFMFESVLNRLAGITFFPLFSFLLMYYKRI